MAITLSTDSLKLLSANDFEALLASEYPELSYLDDCVESSPEYSGTSSSIERLRTLASIKAFHAFLTKNPGELCKAMDERDCEELVSFLDDALPNDTTRQLMLCWIIVHDLGKSQALHTLTSNTDSGMDHDKRLLYCLEHHPKHFPGFSKQHASIKERLYQLLKTELHPVEALQAEGGMHVWELLSTQAPKDVMLHLALLIFDIAGARGTPYLDTHVWRAISCFIKVLGDLRGMSAEDIRSSYLTTRALFIGVQEKSEYTEIMGSLACLLRCTDRICGKQIVAVYSSLPEATRCILNELLSSKESTVTLSYLPALFVHLGATSRNFKKALLAGIHYCCRIYHLGKQYRITHKLTHPMNINVTPLINALKEELHSSEELTLCLKTLEGAVTLHVQRKPGIKRSNVAHRETLSTLPGKNIGLIGIGGGSDCLQAALLGMVLEDYGKSVCFIASIRSNLDAGVKRTVCNTIREPFKDVYQVSKDSHGSGRFLEHLIADRWESYLVLESDDNSLQEQYRFLAHTLHSLDALFLVDTGGDALFPSHSSALMNTTPDQDVRALKASAVIQSIPVYSVIVACGIDAPDDAEDRLNKAHAEWYAFSESEKVKILQQYDQWKDRQLKHLGTDFLGKTPLAFAAALEGMQGYHPLSLPEDHILDEANPWHPYVYLDGGTSESTMAGCFFMLRDNHLKIL